MEKAVFDSYLEGRYRGQLHWYDRKAMQNQRWFERTQLALIVTSAMTPIILVSHFLEHIWWLAALALASSVAGLLITGAMRSFQFEEHWLTYRSTCEDLRSEVHFYEAATHEYSSTPDKEALFVQRVEEILARERRAWREFRNNREPVAVGH